MSDYNVPASVHRENARRMLGGNIFSTNWMMALLVVLVYTLVSSFASSVTAGIAAIVVAGPLSAGLTQYFISLSRTGKAEFEGLFSGFENNFLQNLLIGLMTGIFTFLWSLLFLIPGIVKAYAYSMAYYIHNDNPTYDWKQCLDESQRIMKGKKWKLFCLDLSFLGWIIVSLFTCGIGILWVEPYMQAARASFYESIAEKPAFEQPDFGDPTQSV